MYGRRIAAIMIFVLPVAACSSSGPGAGSGPSTSTTSASSGTTSSTQAAPSGTPSTSASTPSAPSPSAPSGSSVSNPELEAALLTPAEVGPGFTQGTWSDTPSTLPCAPKGSPPIDSQAPPEVKDGREIDHSTIPANLVEVISVYQDAATASRAFALDTQGLSCPNGTLSDGSNITIAPAVDVSTQVDPSGQSKSTDWDLTNNQVHTVIIATLSNRVIEACVFSASASADVSTLPSPIVIAKKAFAKVISG
jgi:hypothetical protein